VQSAKQTARQSIRETKKDTLYSEFKDKVGEIIIGYYQRERNGDIFVDLGKAEGKLPRRFQSPQEEYHAGDRIKAYIAEVNKTPKGLDIVLSRTHAEFVRAIFELEVPEIYDRVVEIHKIVREPGYRTKLAVYSNDKNVDPVGACVGLKGVRIQAVTQELEGEKVDVLKYEVDPRMFIKNALSPAKVKEVIIKDEAKHQALAVVEESSLSLAIGKNGLNVRLANRLVDWMIDVRTESQYKTSDVESDSRRAISKLFREGEDYEEEYSRISDLPGVDEGLLALLSGNGIEEIVDFLEKTTEDLLAIPGISGEQIEALRSLIDTYVEVVEEEEVEAEAETEELEAEAELAADTGKVEDAVAEETAEAPIPAEIEEEDVDEEYECPECGETITEEMTKCPKCGVGLSFEEED
jgi:N utilization substance protein A